MMIQEFMQLIDGLPEDEPIVSSRVWYTTQKEHWLGWLAGYNKSDGPYGRKKRRFRDARYCYNHIVNYKMLIYLVNALEFDRYRVRLAVAETTRFRVWQAKSRIMRRHFPWLVIEEELRNTGLR